MAKQKIRVNITVDKHLLEKSKTKLGMFGGKLSTLFNAYLSDFVESIEEKPKELYQSIMKKIGDLEERLKKMEKKFKI